MIIIKTKTISAHIEASIESELKHQNREIMCNNIDYNRTKNNSNFVYSGGTNDEGKRNLSLEESYHLIFDDSFEKFQNKQRPCRRSECNTYLEHIRKQKENEKINGKRKNTSTPNELYSVIFQVGNKSDSDYDNNKEDFEKTNAILKKTAEKIRELPYVIELTEENKVNFKLPDLPAFIVLQNCNTHCDETCVHLNLSFYCVVNGNSRGQVVSNNSSKCWELLGYPTEYIETNEIKKDKNGNDITNENGTPIYKKELIKKGVLDWMEYIKSEIIEPEMRKENWLRAEKIQGEFNHLSIQDYKIKKKKTEVKELENTIKEKSIDKAISEVDSTLAFYSSEKRYAENYKTTDKTKEFEEYKKTSDEFWEWYKSQKDIVLNEIKEAKDEEHYFDIKINHYNNILIKSAPMLSRLLNLLFKHFYLHKKKLYQQKIDELILSRNKLKQISKDFSAKAYNVREELKDQNKKPDADLLVSLLDLESTLQNEYNRAKNREKISQEKY